MKPTRYTTDERIAPPIADAEPEPAFTSVPVAVRSNSWTADRQRGSWSCSPKPD